MRVLPRVLSEQVNRGLTFHAAVQTGRIHLIGSSVWLYLEVGAAHQGLIRPDELLPPTVVEALRLHLLRVATHPLGRLLDAVDLGRHF